MGGIKKKKNDGALNSDRQQGFGSSLDNKVHPEGGSLFPLHSLLHGPVFSAHEYVHYRIFDFAFGRFCSACPALDSHSHAAGRWLCWPLRDARAGGLASHRGDRSVAPTQPWPISSKDQVSLWSLKANEHIPQIWGGCVCSSSWYLFLPPAGRSQAIICSTESELLFLSFPATQPEAALHLCVSIMPML